MTDAADLATEALVTALRDQAGGNSAAEAAIDLLVDHEDWLTRRDFRAFVEYTDDPDVTGGGPMARIRWARAVLALDSGDLRATGTAARILRIAASLGGGVPVNLRDTITNSLGYVNAGFVVKAIEYVAPTPDINQGRGRGNLRAVRPVEDLVPLDELTVPTASRQQLPTWQQIALNSLEALDKARGALSECRDWQISDWSPVGSSLSDEAGESRRYVLDKVGELKGEIDGMKNSIRRGADLE